MMMTVFYEKYYNEMKQW